MMTLPPSASRSVGEERHAFSIDRLLNSTHDLVKRVGNYIGTTLGHERVDTAEPDKTDRRHPVLGFDSATGEVVPQGPRHGTCHHRWVGVSLNSRQGLDERWSTPSEEPSAFFRGHRGFLRQAGPSSGTDHDLAGPGDILHRRRYRGRRPGHDQLEVRGSYPKHMYLARMHTDRHAQPNRSDRCRNAGGIPESGAHFDRRSARPVGMLGTFEQQQEPVATELQQPTTPRVGEIEHRAERTIQNIGQLLSTETSPPDKPLGQAREARNVDKAETRVERLPC